MVLYTLLYLAILESAILVRIFNYSNLIVTVVDYLGRTIEYITT
jgi:hypothetical protein